MGSFTQKIAPALLLGGLLVSQMGLPAMAMPPKDCMCRHEAEERHILDQLNLSSEQRHKIDAIKQKAKTEAKGYHEQLRNNRKDFETYLFSPNANEATANAKVDQFSNLMSRMGKLRVKTLFQMRSVMTPEQFQKFGKLHQARVEERMKAFENRCHGSHKE